MGIINKPPYKSIIRTVLEGIGLFSSKKFTLEKDWSSGTNSKNPSFASINEKLCEAFPIKLPFSLTAHGVAHKK